MTRPILQATAIAGTLDILAAVGLTLYYGRRSVADMLRFVASGPLPWAPGWGAAGAIAGLIVHFVLMAIMVVVFFWAAERWPVLITKPVLGGIGYGLVTYVVMNLIVVPLRFGAWPPKPASIVTQLFCHVVLVGIPIALAAARTLALERVRPA